MPNIVDVLIRVNKSGTGAAQASAELTQLATQAQTAGRAMQTYGAEIAAVGTSMTMMLTLPLAIAAGAIVTSAAKTTESVNKMKVVFGETAGEIDKFSKTAATSIGLTRQKSIDAASEFGTLFHTMGIGNEEATRMSLTLTKLAGDLASFHNVDTSLALDKLKSGLVGQSKPMREFGVVIDETAVSIKAVAMGLADTTGAVDQHAKMLARYALIMEETALQQGDWDRTSGELTNKIRTLKSSVGDLAASMGERLIPMATVAIGKFTDLVVAFNGLNPKVQTTIVTLGGLAALSGPITAVTGHLMNFAGWLTRIIGGGTLAYLARGIVSVADAGAALKLAFEPLVDIFSKLVPLFGRIIPLAAAATAMQSSQGPSLTDLSISGAGDKNKKFASWMLTPQKDPTTGDWKNLMPAGYDMSRGYPMPLEAKGAGPGAGPAWAQFMLDHPELVTMFANIEQHTINITEADWTGSPETLAANEALSAKMKHSSWLSESIIKNFGGTTDDLSPVIEAVKKLQEAADAVTFKDPLTDKQKADFELLTILLDNGAGASENLRIAISNLMLTLGTAPGAIGTKIGGGFITPASIKENELEKRFGQMMMFTNAANFPVVTQTDLQRNVDKAETERKRAQAEADAAATKSLNDIAKKWDDFAKAITNSLTDATEAAKKLFDATGGMPGSTKPGGDSWAEPFFRMADVAASKDRGKGKDTDKWMNMYYPGMGLDEASAAAKGDVGNFEMGNLLAKGVFEKIDWNQMADQAIAQQSGANTMEYAGQAVAGLKSAGKPLTPENIKAMIEQLAAADKNGLVPSIDKVTSAVDAAKKDSNTNLNNVLTALKTLPADIAKIIPAPASTTPPPASGPTVPISQDPRSVARILKGTSNGPELVNLPMGGKSYNPSQGRPQTQGVGGLGNLMDVIAQKAGASVEDVADALISAASVHVQGGMLKALQRR